MTSGHDTVPMLTGLVVIARNACGQIVTRITSHRDLVGTIHTGHCVLTLKLDAARVEAYYAESLTSNYQSLPLATISRDDLSMAQIQ